MYLKTIKPKYLQNFKNVRKLQVLDDICSKSYYLKS